jgi:hypothetical protein
LQILIKISEEDYINLKNAINSLIENGVERASMSKICLAILDGTPLPKGHGRLIDADAVLEEPIGNTYKDIDIAETIIEADKAENEDKE